MNRSIFILIYCVILMPLSWLVPHIWLSVLVLGTGIPHIILGAKYSRRGLSRSWQVPWQKALLLILIPVSIAIGMSWPLVGLVIYFGVHHGISETYCDEFSTKKGTLYATSHFVLIVSAYLIACRQNIPNLAFLREVLGLTALLSLLTLLMLERKKLTTLTGWVTIFKQQPWILAAPLIIGLSLVRPFAWQVLILFHFAYWGLLPVFRKGMFQKNSAQLKVFWKDALQWNSTWLVLIGSLGAWSYLSGDFRLFQLVLLLFYIATYWHITISFIVSGSNPNWVRQIFAKNTVA